jgi:hypothetical protein
MGTRMRERLLEWADNDNTLHYREVGEGEGKEWGLTVIRLYIIEKWLRARERTFRLA